MIWLGTSEHNLPYYGKSRTALRRRLICTIRRRCGALAAPTLLCLVAEAIQSFSQAWQGSEAVKVSHSACLSTISPSSLVELCNCKCLEKQLALLVKSACERTRTLPKTSSRGREERKALGSVRALAHSRTFPTHNVD